MLQAKDDMKFYLLAVMILLQGCQQTSEQVIAKSDSKNMVINKIVCQKSTTPLLKSTQKLKEMLIAKGKIDASLSDKEIDQAVKTYINKKNSALKICKNKSLEEK
jgi:ATP sulfurylase